MADVREGQKLHIVRYLNVTERTVRVFSQQAFSFKHWEYIKFHFFSARIWWVDNSFVFDWEKNVTFSIHNSSLVE